MKRLGYKRYVPLVIWLICAISDVSALDLTRQIDRSFTIRNDTRIEVENKFGNVIVNKWDKPVFQLKVSIEAKGSSEAKAQKILDAIEIEISDRISSGYLGITTEIDQIKGNNSFSVNYEISMPVTNTMKLSNSFGNVYMGSYEGPLDLTVKYGQLMAEDLDRANIRVEFSNSKCSIEALKSGSVDIRYSKMQIDQTGDIEIMSQFSEMQIGNAGLVQIDGRYGKFEFGSIKSLMGELQFAGLAIEHLGETIRIEAKHGDGINLENVSRNFKNIDIDGQFSSININLERGTTARLRFELQFGNLKAEGAGISFNKVIKDHTSSEYEGYLGKSDAASGIRVTNKYGNIRLQAG